MSYSYFLGKGFVVEICRGQGNPEDFALYWSEYLEKIYIKGSSNYLTIETSTGPHNKKIIYLNDTDISTLANEAVK